MLRKACIPVIHTYIHVYTYIPIYIPMYMHTHLSAELWKYIASSCLGARIFFLKFQKEKTNQMHLCLWEITIALSPNFNTAKTLTKQKSWVFQMSNMRLQTQVSLSEVYWRNAWPLLYLPVLCFLPLLDNRLTFLFRVETVKLVFQHQQSVCWILSLYLLTWKKKIPITFWISSHFNAVQNSQK